MDIKKIAFKEIGMGDAAKLNELYDGSALTIIGCSSMKDAADDLEYFVNFIEEKCGGWKEGAEPVIYEVSGEVMDKMYKLHGTNAYPDDLNIVIIPLEFFANAAELAIGRFAFEGRWFDDVVDNNARREKEQGNIGVTFLDVDVA